MLSRLRIGHRLLLLIGVQVAALLAMGAAGLVGLNLATSTTAVLNQHVREEAQLSYVSETIQTDLLETVGGINSGRITWQEAREGLSKARSRFEDSWGTLTAGGKFKADRALQPSVESLRGAFVELAGLLSAENRGHLSLYVLNDLTPAIAPFINALRARVTRQKEESDAAFQQSLAQDRLFLVVTLVVFVIGLFAASGLGLIIFRSVSAPIRSLATTVQQVAAGDYYARTGITGRDELGELAQAFDGLLEDKVASLVGAQEESERLNESVIHLLEAVAQLSQRDLTVRVPVTEDVTGPVADALNLLTSETSKVLHGVRRISQNVSDASSRVKTQSDNVIQVAVNEQAEISKTAEELSTASEAMLRIAKLAQACYAVADKTIKTTAKAHETVSSTVSGINNSRDTIRETEKRIKRLGERSQEISGVVNLINSIAERTHILALNASMHAASAGEAGRGFAVVADEVQRLAENAREATAQIATLVSNIQTETADTVNTMNEAIREVVEGSNLAEQAGQQMQVTQKSTTELVEMVRKIAIASKQQAQSSNELRKRAGSIQETSRQTAEQLTEQTRYTRQLVEAAHQLIDAVRVFRLPEVKSATEEPGETSSSNTVVEMPAPTEVASANA